MLGSGVVTTVGSSMSTTKVVLGANIFNRHTNALNLVLEPVAVVPGVPLLSMLAFLAVLRSMS